MIVTFNVNVCAHTRINRAIFNPYMFAFLRFNYRFSNILFLPTRVSLIARVAIRATNNKDHQSGGMYQYIYIRNSKVPLIIKIHYESK